MVIGTLNAYKYLVLTEEKEIQNFTNENSVLGIQNFDTSTD